MRIKVNKTNITFTGVANESQLRDITFAAEQSKCKYESKDHSTKIIVTGNLNKFIKVWNG